MGIRKSYNGMVFGRLTVVGDGYMEPSPSGKLLRYVLCECLCGTTKDFKIKTLKDGRTTSCGCYQKETMTTHGEYKTRLYNEWRGMKSRSHRRLLNGDKCNVFIDWQDSFDLFKVWAMDNGYTDDMYLCRNGDVGDYSPSNCRWDTAQSNTEEAISKKYIVTEPNGDEYEILNLAKFCRDNGLGLVNMRYVVSGRQKQHKGWRCRHV